MERQEADTPLRVLRARTLYFSAVFFISFFHINGIRFRVPQETRMCLPGDIVRERATSSHGMVKEGVNTHTLGTGGEGSPLSTDTS